jgi:huntingtin
VDPAQYEWMLSELLDLYQNYPNEDEIMMQYLLPALCKALAVLKMVSIDFFSNLVYCLTGKE